MSFEYFPQNVSSDLSCVNVNTTSSQGKHAVTQRNLPYLLSEILKKNDVKILNLLLSTRKSTTDLTFIWNEFLFQCTEFGKTEMIRILIKNGWNIDIQNTYGETPLHVAVAKGDLNCVKCILEFNPNVGWTTNDNWSVYDYSVDQGNKEIIRLLSLGHCWCIPPSGYQAQDIGTSNANSGKLFEARDTIKNKANRIFNRKVNINYNSSDNCNYSYSESNEDRSNKSDDFYDGNLCDEEGVCDISEGNIHVNIENEVNPITKASKKHSKSNFIRISNTLTDQENNCKSQTKYEDPNDFDTVTKHDFYYEDWQKIITTTANAEANKSDFPLIEFSDSVANARKPKPNKINKVYSNPLSKSIPNIISLTKRNKRNPQKSAQMIHINKSAITSNITLMKHKNNASSLIKSSTNALNESNTALNNRMNPSASSWYYFLKDINLESFAPHFIRNGFDNIAWLIEQTKTRDIAISYENWHDIGIKSPGDRARLIIRWEEKAKLFDFNIDRDKVYYNSCLNNNSLYRMWSSIKMESYTDTFINSGYYSSDLLFIQMLTLQPVTDEIMKEIGIDKIGYRRRIINKIRNDSRTYANRLKNKMLVLDGKNGGNDRNDFCNLCVIM